MVFLWGWVGVEGSHATKLIPLIYAPSRLVYSGASLIRIIHLSGHLFGNQSPFLNRKWLIYPEIQLFGQSVWEQRCPDKSGSTVYQFVNWIWFEPVGQVHNNYISQRITFLLQILVGIKGNIFAIIYIK